MDILEHRTDKGRSRDFAFDYDHNIVRFGGSEIRLSPYESDVLRILLRNRAGAIPIHQLVHQVYGSAAPDSAAVSIRVLVHALRKKLRHTGISITAEARRGYRIDSDVVPELSNELSDRILIALDTAKALGEFDVAECLQTAYDQVERERRDWLSTAKPMTRSMEEPSQRPLPQSKTALKERSL